MAVTVRSRRPAVAVAAGTFPIEDPGFFGAGAVAFAGAGAPGVAAGRRLEQVR